MSLHLFRVAEETILCNKPDGSTIELAREWLLTAHEKKQIAVISGGHVPAQDWCSHSSEELEIASRRQAMLESPPPETVVSSRTLRRWAARQRVAEANGEHEVLALVRRIPHRGNRTARISEMQMAVIDRVIDEHWRNSKAINFKACYKFLEIACEQEGVKPISYPTLIKHIKATETNQDVRMRYGKRIAYQQDTFVPVLHYDTQVHGHRPLQYVHIDHTQLDIEVISSRTGKPLGRPWLTFAVDAWSRRIVAFYLTFDSPSYVSVMMVIRDLVRRYRRLPQFIVVDNGTDFHASAFVSFLRGRGTKLRFRPAGQPRHGTVLERMFGRVHTEYISNLAGNTKATKNVRSVTGSHLPEKLAEWNIQQLYYGIQHWATEYYDQQRHPALDESPRDAFQRGMRESGMREQTHILFNRDFLIATCPPVDRTGSREVHRQRGVKVGDRFYWSEAFRASNVAGKKIPVRYDPWDASSVYVWVKDQWHQAICRALLGLGQLTEVEQKLVSQEFHRRTKTKEADPHARQRLREFLQVFTPEGAIATALERQAENKSLYNSLQLASITPVPKSTQFSLTEETSSAAGVPAEQRSTTTNPSTPLHEATGLDDSFDFDDF